MNFNGTYPRLDYEDVETHLIELDDTFKFHCTACGKCCQHREDILLTPFDVFRIAVYLNRQPVEIIDRYCDVYPGTDSHMPVVRLVPVLPDQRCPFLRNKKCAIHTAKPTVCFLFPLARVFTSETDGARYYRQPDVACGNESRTVTVREWIGKNYSAEYEQCGKMWSDFLFLYGRAVRHCWSKLSEKAKSELLTTAFPLLYLGYDIRTAFIPQFKQMLSRLTAFLATQIELPDIPEWMEIEDVSDKDLRRKLILYKAYGLYKKELCVAKGENHLVQSDTAAVKKGLYSSITDFSNQEFLDPEWLSAHLPEKTVKRLLCV